MISPLKHTKLLDPTLQNLFYPPPKGEYTYFARAAEKPFATCGTLVKAAWAADAAMLAYAKYGVGPGDPAMPLGGAITMTDAELDVNFARAGLAWEKIGSWTSNGTQAYFASGPEFAILAFRGTEADDPSDLVTDGNLFLWHEKDYCGGKRDPAPGMGMLAAFEHLAPCLVHKGFQTALDSVWDDVAEKVNGYIQTHRGKEICFTGHSLGGALALLAFSRFVDEDISVYTFGCPRVGNEAFRERTMCNAGRGIYRFVNYNDAVTHIPTESLLYRQTPTECYRFTANGDLDYGDDDSFTGDLGKLGAAISTLHATAASWQRGLRPDLNAVLAPDSFVDHSPARYCFRLWDCV